MPYDLHKSFNVTELLNLWSFVTQICEVKLFLRTPLTLIVSNSVVGHAMTGIDLIIQPAQVRVAFMLQPSHAISCKILVLVNIRLVVVYLCLNLRVWLGKSMLFRKTCAETSLWVKVSFNKIISTSPITLFTVLQ